MPGYISSSRGKIHSASVAASDTRHQEGKVPGVEIAPGSKSRHDLQAGKVASISTLGCYGTQISTALDVISSSDSRQKHAVCEVGGVGIRRA